jgi:hypothetical protein
MTVKPFGPAGDGTSGTIETGPLIFKIAPIHRADAIRLAGFVNRC